MNFNITDVVGFLIVYQCLLFVFFLLFNRKAKPFFIKMLLTICVCIAVHFSYMVIGQSLDSPFNVLGPFFGLLYGPLYFHFSQSLIFKNGRKKIMIWHYVPAFLITVALLLLKDQIWDHIAILSLVITCHFAVYLIAILYLIFRFRRKLQKAVASYVAIDLKWLEVAVYIQLLVLLTALLESFVTSAIGAHVLVFVVYVLVLVLIHCFYFYGLKHVGIFEGFKNENSSQKIVAEFVLDSKVFERYSKKLEAYMQNHKPYLEFNVSLGQLSEALGINTRNLSYVINKKYGKNFYEFVNGYRLLIAKKMLVETDKQIKEVMYESGFSNKATFNTFFKKQIGITPSQFREASKNKV